MAMATSRDDFQAEGKQKCPICLCDFKIPRQLPCMHSFCEKCLQNYLSSQEEKLKKHEHVKCPICRQDVSTSKQGKPVPSLASQFPINVILQSILGDSKVKVNQPCDACHSAGISSQAQGMCVVCEEAMCKTCSVVHQNQKFSRNHVIISMEQFSSNPQNVMKLAKGFNCPEHDGEAIDFYCKEHKTACCSKCCILSHRKCANVSDLKNELPYLLQEMNADSIHEQMKKIEAHLIKFTEVNESNISLLESQVNDLTSQIRGLRKKINDVLDKLESTVKIAGHRICKEEIIKKQEENHHCQSLISSVRNSRTLLETIKKYGTETQVFLTSEKMSSQLTSYIDQIQENYTKTETTTILLNMIPQVKLIMSASPDILAKITSRKNCQQLSVPVIRKPFRNCLFQLDKLFEISNNNNSAPNYTGIAYLYSGHVVVADYNNNQILLLNLSDNNLLSSCQLPCRPCEVCVVNDTDTVAVTIPTLNTVQFLSVGNGKITPTGKIATRYKYDGISAAGNGKIVLSGGNADGYKYWSLISSEGKEEFCHQFDCQGDASYTYVALNSSFTLVYITVEKANCLFCFEMSGSQKFAYRHDSLVGPCGVVTDKYDNVYVIGYDSNNIHQLTPYGAVIQIISDGIPAIPMAICISRDGNKILVTTDLEQTKIYQYELK